MSSSIDLHVHTSVGSACSMLEISDMLREARAAELDGIVVTDHETFRGARLARRWGEELGFPVFFGVEIRTLEGDCLVYVDEEFDPEPYRRAPARELLAAVTDLGGVMVVAHPFRRSAPSLGERVFELDGLSTIEVRNGNCSADETALAIEAAESLKLFSTGGSDAHGPGQVGRCYTVFEAEIRSQGDLLRELRRGAHHPVSLR